MSTNVQQGETWPEKWSGDCTVGNMIANLRTLPPEMPLYTAYHIPMDGEPSLLRVKRPTMSRERVDGITIKTGDKTVPYSAVIWTQPQDPLEAHPSPTPATLDEGAEGEPVVSASKLLDLADRLAQRAEMARSDASRKDATPSGSAAITGYLFSAVSSEMAAEGIRKLVSEAHPSPTPAADDDRLRVAVERFRDALANLPDVEERQRRGEQFNAYDLAQDDGFKALCIGPITARPLSLFEAPGDVADLVEAAFRIALAALNAGVK